MELMGSKRARHQDSIKNLPTCGGNSKSGLPKTLGMTNTNKAERGRLAVSAGAKPGLACTGAIFTTKRNQVNAGGVGKYTSNRKYTIATVTTGGYYM